MPEETKKTNNGLAKAIKRILLIVLETVLLFVIGVYGLLYTLAKGPSVTARNLFVHSMNETSALKFIPSLFLKDEEIAEILATDEEIQVEDMDVSLLSDSAEEDDIWVTEDTDGDGIIIEEVKGGSYTGYMMIVKDPMRVQVAIDEKNFGGKGHTVEEFCEMFDAVAAMNGGGFEDENGQGNGGSPDSVVVYDGEIFGWYGTKNGFVGIDDEGILHVDCQNTAAIREANIQYGCAYGPILVENGKVSPNLREDGTGINPRTAIGQRADKSILMLVIDGRHVKSLGATYNDLAQVMLDYGAINAGNMDGGSSTLMYFNHEYVNNKAAVIGIRPIPTAWIVTP